jgi:hypothetical protein
VGQGLIQRGGSGHSKDPYRYWLRSREALLFPEGGTMEELREWNRRMLQEDFGRLEQGPGRSLASDLCAVAGADPLMAAGEAEGDGTPVPPEEASPSLACAQTALPPLPNPDPPPTLSAPAEPPPRLPWPWNTADPSKVPEWVWEQARRAAALGKP